MSKLIGLLCAAALSGIAQGTAHAEDRACKFVEWGYSYFRIEQQSETWTFLLTASGPHWRSIPSGYHAPGYLVSSIGHGGGLYHFNDQADLRPPTAAERAKRRNEWVGIPVDPDNLVHYGSREGIALGPLTGYAVLYRFVAKEGRNTFADLLAAREGGILVINLTDGCVSFEMTVLLGSNSGPDPWVPLDSLLTEVTIEKSPGARAGPRPPPGTGYSAVVRPRRKDE